MSAPASSVSSLCSASPATKELASLASPLPPLVKNGRSETAIDLIVLGPGKVGSTLLNFLGSPAYRNVRLLGVANSRTMLTAPKGIALHQALPRLSASDTANDLGALTDFLLSYSEYTPVIVDATASDAVARLHPEWLARGIHVVTANKTAAAEGWIQAGHRARYGDAATVGAGLPILSSLRRLKSAGDRITRVEGVLSGSLAYLFHALESGQDFSAALAQAQKEGYTEPDPRCDLRGDDVARKLAIIARAAGFEVEALPVPESLVPHADASLSASPRDAGGGDSTTDSLWRKRVEQAKRENRALRYVACATAENTRIETRAVSRCSPLAQTRGAEICVAIYSHAYRNEPLIVRGPGAGVEVTARALLADILQAAGS